MHLAGASRLDSSFHRDESVGASGELNLTGVSAGKLPEGALDGQALAIEVDGDALGDGNWRFPNARLLGFDAKSERGFELSLRKRHCCRQRARLLGNCFAAQSWRARSTRATPSLREDGTVSSSGGYPLLRSRVVDMAGGGYVHSILCFHPTFEIASSIHLLCVWLESSLLRKTSFYSVSRAMHMKPNVHMFSFIQHKYK